MLHHYQERFTYVMVDEYQDTNRAQYELVNQLSAAHHNVCVVGDADQGVYSWRGATIQNILDFERDYPDANVFLMEQNYRSTQNILAVANALIEKNQMRKPKTLWTEAGNGELSIHYRAQDEHEEAMWVAVRDRAAARERGIPVPRRRDLLPDERPVAGARGHLHAVGHPVSGVRRRAVLPAPRDQGRGRATCGCC